MARETNQQSQQTQPSGSSSQQQRGNEQVGSRDSSATAAGGGSAGGISQSGGSDRERSIQTGRDSERGAQRSTALGGRQGGSSVYGGGTDPFVLMQRMAQDMDRLFEQFGFGRSGLLSAPSMRSLVGDDRWSSPLLGQGQEGMSWSPQVETFRRGDKLVVRADIPGVKKEDVHVEVDDGMLAITGERRDEREEDREGIYRSERSYGQFYRAIPLPEGVNTDEAEATFTDGVLEVALPAPPQQERKAKRLQVR
jgi:HSP20 family protein